MNRREEALKKLGLLVDLEAARELLQGGRNGVEKWNHYREEGREISDLRGIALTAADLKGVDFRKMDLSQADLRNANLTKARLSGAHLRRCFESLKEDPSLVR